jgi:hypothetical protein
MPRLKMRNAENKKSRRAGHRARLILVLVALGFHTSDFEFDRQAEPEKVKHPVC